MELRKTLYFEVNNSPPSVCMGGQRTNLVAKPQKMSRLSFDPGYFINLELTK